jgi:putative transposase
MPSRLKRWHTFGHDHFITFSCYHRHPYLNDDHSRTVFLNTLERARQKHSFQVYGYVLMPEHVHLLLNAPPKTKLADIFRALKTETSKQLRGDRPRFWQYRYYDFNVYTQPKFIEKLQYIHRNPVTRGLVTKPEDWPWSSFDHWVCGTEGSVEIESHWTWAKRERQKLNEVGAPFMTVSPS